MIEILNQYESVSLSDMKSVRLMNRIDTKYVTTLPLLERLLEQAREEYRVQEIDHRRNMPYYTLYYDTEACDMYLEHLRGRKCRQKIRIRKYESSGLSFLEIKNKNNKGRTEKRRIPYEQEKEQHNADFIRDNSHYLDANLRKRVENRFSRITLVNRQMTERLTIDTDLRFHNLTTGEVCALKDLVIIELKRDGNTYSPILEMLRQLRIHPAKFSKYCMSMALTDHSLKRNRFKPRLMMINKLCEVETGGEWEENE